MKEKIRAALHMITGKDLQEVSDEDSLLKAGINSIAFIQCIVLLEEEFHCLIPGEKMFLYELDSISKLEEVFDECIEGNTNAKISD